MISHSYNVPGENAYMHLYPVSEVAAPIVILGKHEGRF
jgi:hypothetical protein